MSWLIVLMGLLGAVCIIVGALFGVMVTEKRDKESIIDYLVKHPSREGFKMGQYLLKPSASDENLPNEYVCACGNKHPLVAEFGKCGACMSAIM